MSKKVEIKVRLNSFDTTLYDDYKAKISMIFSPTFIGNVRFFSLEAPVFSLCFPSTTFLATLFTSLTDGETLEMAARAVNAEKLFISLDEVPSSRGFVLIELAGEFMALIFCLELSL